MTENASTAIRRRVAQLAAEWLRDQADNGWDGSVEFLLDGLTWDEATFELTQTEARLLADRLDDDSCLCCGGQGTVGDGGYVECPACGPAAHGVMSPGYGE